MGKRKRERTLRIIRWLAIGSAALAVVAVVFMVQARRNLNNIELLNFVDALTNGQIVNIDPEKISTLKRQIVKERKIKD